MENGVDPDQMASLEASWSGSSVFSKKINPGSAGQWSKTSVYLVRNQAIHYKMISLISYY